MSSKNIFILIFVAIAALAAGAVYFFKSQNMGPVQPAQPAAESHPASSTTTTFDANDNLDQATQDLNIVAK